jgi:hypothetical protein
MSIFEFFFKYKPIVYQKGQVAFQLLGSRGWFLVFVIAALAGAYYAYRKRREGQVFDRPRRVASVDLHRPCLHCASAGVEHQNGAASGKLPRRCH